MPVENFSDLLKKFFVNEIIFTLASFYSNRFIKNSTL